MTLATPVQETMSQRELIKQSRRAEQQETSQSPSTYAVWYNATEISDQEWTNIVPMLARSRYSGVLLAASVTEAQLSVLPSSLKKLVLAKTVSDVEATARIGKDAIVVSDDEGVLNVAKMKKLTTCFRAFVDSNSSLHAAIHNGKRHAYLAIRFRDPTNIPLELVIASLQPSGTVLINEISDSESVEAAIVALGVMEVGADGIMFSPRTPATIKAFASALESRSTDKLQLVDATVIQSKPVGMGYRSCIDLATLFDENEGMLIGSTSHGGILCCPEVFHLPYMELRPFRVNAGAVHSYVYGPNNQTSYLTELRAGSETLIVGLDGKARLATVGRIKTELRPLRLIEVETEKGTRINTIMQDDWHVRVFSADGKPLNITHLKPGDKIRALEAVAGRHVGIAVEEHIIEN